MKKIVGTVISMSDDSLYTQFYCVGDDGKYDGVVSATLCRAVAGLLGPQLEEFLHLLDAAGRGEYPPGAIDCADIVTYSTAIWLRPPHAPAGHVVIENTTARSPGEERVTRMFTYEQVRITAQLAVRFDSELATQGEESFLGRCLEVDLPG